LEILPTVWKVRKLQPVPVTLRNLAYCQSGNVADQKKKMHFVLIPTCEQQTKEKHKI